MKVYVKARPAANEERFKKIGNTDFEIWVQEPPVRGKANGAMAKALADHFGVAEHAVSLVSGFRSKQKVFEITQ